MFPIDNKLGLKFSAGKDRLVVFVGTSERFLTGPCDTNGSKQRENAFIPLIIALWTICAFHPVTCFMVSNDAPNLTQASVKNRAQFGDIFDTVPVL